MAKDPGTTTTKLEWARQLGDSDLAVLDDPAARTTRRWAAATCPPAETRCRRRRFLKMVWDKYAKRTPGKEGRHYAN